MYRENNEMLIAIKKMSPDGKIPRGLLINGKPFIKDQLKEYEMTRMLDRENEKHPNRSNGNSPIARIQRLL